MEDKASELKKRIAALESADPASKKLKEYKNELERLTKGAEVATAGLAEIPGISPEDYESAGASKAGLHVSEFGMPYWKTPGISIAFPFTIIEGDATGTESEIFVGVSKKALFKLKEILVSLGVEIKKTKSGNVGFDFTEVAGKQGQTFWAMQKDIRPFDQGGTGSSYPKPISVLPLGAAPPEEPA